MRLSTLISYGILAVTSVAHEDVAATPAQKTLTATEGLPPPYVTPPQRIPALQCGHIRNRKSRSHCMVSARATVDWKPPVTVTVPRPSGMPGIDEAEKMCMTMAEGPSTGVERMNCVRSLVGESLLPTTETRTTEVEVKTTHVHGSFVPTTISRISVMARATALPPDGKKEWARKMCDELPPGRREACLDTIPGVHWRDEAVVDEISRPLEERGTADSEAFPPDLKLEEEKCEQLPFLQRLICLRKTWSQYDHPIDGKPEVGGAGDDEVFSQLSPLEQRDTAGNEAYPPDWNREGDEDCRQFAGVQRSICISMTRGKYAHSPVRDLKAEDVGGDEVLPPPKGRFNDTKGHYERLLELQAEARRDCLEVPTTERRLCFERFWARHRHSIVEDVEAIQADEYEVLSPPLEARDAAAEDGESPPDLKREEAKCKGLPLQAKVMCLRRVRIEYHGDQQVANGGEKIRPSLEARDTDTSTDEDLRREQAERRELVARGHGKTWLGKLWDKIFHHGHHEKRGVENLKREQAERYELVARGHGKTWLGDLWDKIFHHHHDKRGVEDDGSPCRKLVNVSPDGLLCIKNKSQTDKVDDREGKEKRDVQITEEGNGILDLAIPVPIPAAPGPQPTTFHTIAGPPPPATTTASHLTGAPPIKIDNTFLLDASPTVQRSVETATLANGTELVLEQTERQSHDVHVEETEHRKGEPEEDRVVVHVKVFVEHLREKAEGVVSKAVGWMG